MRVEGLLERMNEIFDAARSLPWGMHALVAVALLGGLALWLVGQSILKPLIVTLCTIVGGAVGLMLLPSFGLGELRSYELIGLGLVGGLVVGLVVYRSAMALAFGVVLGTLAPLAAAAYLDFRATHFDSMSETEHASASSAWFSETGRWAMDRTEAARAWGDDARRRVETVRPFMGFIQPASYQGEEGPGDDPAPSRSRVREAIDALRNNPAYQANIPSDRDANADTEPGRFLGDSSDARASFDDSTGGTVGAAVKQFIGDATAKLGERWRSRSADQQAVIAGAGVIGLGLGVTIGLWMPAWGAGAVTAMFGSAVWLAAFSWLSGATSMPWRYALERTPGEWLGIWAGCAFLGACIQWSGVLKRKKHKPKAEGE